MREEDGREIPAETGANLAQTEALVVDEHDFLYVLVGAKHHAGSQRGLPDGFRWASDPDPRYGSRWSRRRA